MKKTVMFLAILALLSLTLMAAGVKVSVLTFYTSDLQSGAANVWPILYFNVPLTNSLGIRLEDYVLSSHKTFKLGNVPVVEPTYWYFTYRDGGLNAYVGHFKSKHTLTRKMYMLRVGGFYDSLTGAEVDYHTYTYDVGARYDLVNRVFGAYAGYKTYNSRIYFYAAQDTYKSSVWHLSMNADFRKDLGMFYVNAWGALAYDLDISSPTFGIPTFLMGGKVSKGNFDFEAQFAKQPSKYAARIWYDFNDPNKAGYPLMDFNSMVTYKLDSQNSVGLLANWNSNLSKPTLGFVIQHGDLSLSVGSGDLNGGINGVQYITLSYSNYFSIPLTTHPVFSSGERNW